MFRCIFSDSESFFHWCETKTEPWSVSMDSAKPRYIVAHIFRNVLHVVFASWRKRRLAASKFVSESMVCSTRYCFCCPVSINIKSIINCLLNRKFPCLDIEKLCVVARISDMSDNHPWNLVIDPFFSYDMCSGFDSRNILYIFVVEGCRKSLWRRSICELVRNVSK